MSLVGNLEDLSLGDILQIISLSQKSGVLALASDHGSGRIVFDNGVVTAACLKGGPNDLRELLLRGGFIDPAGYDAALARAQDGGVAVEETLECDADLPAERIEGMIRDAAESAILEMFSWPAGDFSFDVRAEPEPEDPHLILPTGINAQYLAMEGLRLRDERERDGEHAGDPAAAPDASPPAPVHDPLFGEDLLETDADPSLDSTLPEGEILAAHPDASRPDEGASTHALVDAVIARVDDADEDELATTAAPTEATSPDGAPNAPDAMPLAAVKKMPVVLIDPDVVVLEWAKAAVEAEFARVHVFQQADQGLARIRQYLIRGETPLVVIAAETPIDPLSGIRGLGDFVKRLKTQAPRLRVLGLRDESDEVTEPVSMPNVLDGVLGRPSRRSLADRGQPDMMRAGQMLCEAMLGALVPQSSPGAATDPDARFEVELPATGDVEGAADPREAARQLEQASSRGEVMPVVLDFAAKLFARVAILVMRDEAVFAVAGRGIPTLEVDPLDSAPSISFPMPESGWLRRVVETGRIQTGPPQEEADLNLLGCFGGDSIEVAYVAPIESDSAVIALLYADQGSAAAPMPQTDGLEAVLQAAGQALDRAALERALWEVDADGL